MPPVAPTSRYEPLTMSVTCGDDRVLASLGSLLGGWLSGAAWPPADAERIVAAAHEAVTASVVASRLGQDGGPALAHAVVRLDCSVVPTPCGPAVELRVCDDRAVDTVETSLAEITVSGDRSWAPRPQSVDDQALGVVRRLMRTVTVRRTPDGTCVVMQSDPVSTSGDTIAG